MSSFLYTVDYNNIKSPRASVSTTSRRTSSSSTNPNPTSAPTTKKFSMKAALSQLKPTDAQITPSGIYTPIIKRGPLFSGLAPTDTPIHPSGIYSPIIKRGPLFSGLRRSSKTDSHASASPSQSRKHSVTQARVDAALLR